MTESGTGGGETDGDGADGDPIESGESKWLDVRRATGGELTAVLGVLDGANLETDADAIRTAIGDGDVLVAESTRPDESTTSAAADETTVLGALVLGGAEITHVAVRRGRRGQGIGRALVREAAAGEGRPLTAEFDAPVRPFYDALGFAVEPADEDGRWVGRGPLPDED